DTYSVLTTPVTGPAHGTVTLNSDGSFVYLPTAGYSGADSFTYKVQNNNDTTLTDTATVNITVGTVVWYVNNSLGSNGDGRSNSPFNTLTNVNAANGTGDADA